MAKDKKKEESKVTATVPSASKGSRSSGLGKERKKRQELRRCRKALRHHKARKWNTEALEQHIRAVTSGTPTEVNQDKRQRRQAQEAREATKRAAKVAREPAQASPA